MFDAIAANRSSLITADVPLLASLAPSPRLCMFYPSACIHLAPLMFFGLVDMDLRKSASGHPIYTQRVNSHA